MPKATDEQRKAFGDALRFAMRTHAEATGHPDRDDEWLGAQVGLTGQAIRNYLAGLREPKNAAIVEQLEDALTVPRYSLGRHLGYGPAVSEQWEELNRRVDALDRTLAQVLELLAALGQPVPPPAKPSRRGRQVGP